MVMIMMRTEEIELVAEAKQVGLTLALGNTISRRDVAISQVWSRADFSRPTHEQTLLNVIARVL